MVEPRILIVDDDDDIREIAQVSLEIVGGWQVLTARSGPEALSIAEAERPDAILLDVMMPDMDGPATFERLKKGDATRDIPVIFLTAKVQAAERRRFEELGAASLIAKPFDPLKLAEQVSQALGWS